MILEWLSVDSPYAGDVMCLREEVLIDLTDDGERNV